MRIKFFSVSTGKSVKRRMAQKKRKKEKEIQTKIKKIVFNVCCDNEITSCQFEWINSLDVLCICMHHSVFVALFFFFSSFFLFAQKKSSPVQSHLVSLFRHAVYVHLFSHPSQLCIPYPNAITAISKRVMTLKLRLWQQIRQNGKIYTYSACMQLLFRQKTECTFSARCVCCWRSNNA